MKEFTNEEFLSWSDGVIEDTIGVLIKTPTCHKCRAIIEKYPDFIEDEGTAVYTHTGNPEVSKVLEQYDVASAPVILYKIERKNFIKFIKIDGDNVEKFCKGEMSDEDFVNLNKEQNHKGE